MKKPVIESKGNGRILVVVGLIFAAISIAIAILLSDSMFEGDDVAEQMLSVLPSFLPLAIGAVLISMGIRFSKTKISVYDDHIEGNCIVDKLNRDFYLKYEKISNVSFDKSVLLIQSDAITHKINLSVKDASQIARFINTKI